MSRPQTQRNAWAAALATRASRFLTPSSFLSLTRIAGAAAGFLTQVILARTLHASSLGVFFSVTSLAAVVGLIAAYGFPAIAPRFLSRYRERGKIGLMAAFVSRARTDAAVYAVLATAAVMVFGLLWPALSTEARLGEHSDVVTIAFLK